ncbi:dystroglycan-like [Dorcoceras hygrometricum]|uniref:Dystroglycan-like n=1 Tax=Dorcoceras hygrometricum TaxID=472368 RepID=A0A2Z7BAJ8_9LAMI|nr:dystroglycan-like [Dorcoceras hygrometricum]
MASAFITYSYQINFESVLMIHDHEGMLNMFKALEASGLRKFLGCESILYEKELGDFFDTALIQGEDITGVISGKFVTISPTLFSTVFDLPTEGITNFSEIPKDKVYDARSLFSQKGLQIDVHGKKKFMKHEFRLLNDILAKAITVKAGSFDSVTVERFQMMTAIQYGLKVNWGKVLFNVLKDMVDRTQKKAKGFAAQIGVLFKGIPAIPMGDGVPFPSAKVLSMRTVHTYVVTNTTIDARTESEEPGMAKTPKGKKKHSSADEMPVDMFAEFTASKKRSATAADAPIITKKRRTGKSKPSASQAKLDIVQVATDIEPIQIVDPTHVEGTVPPLVLKRKSRKRKLVLSKESDDDSVGTEEIFKQADDVVVMSTVEADIAKVLEETLAFGVTETDRESQAFDEALFEEDFTRWLDDFIARHNEPALGSIHSVADKEVNMPIDDLLIQICDDLLLPVTAAEVTMLRLGAFSSSGDKGKAKFGEDEQVTDNAARKLFALICRDVEVLVQVRDHLMQAVVDFFASFSLNSMPDMDSLKELKEKERLMLAWAETNTLAIAVRRQLYVLAKYRELLLRTVLESYQRYLTSALPWNAMAVQVANLLSVAHSNSIEELKALQQELNIELVQSHSSLPAMDYTDSGDVRLAHFYSITNSSCWVRPVFLMNEVWTPVQGPEFWSSRCNLSLFLDHLQMAAPAVQEIFLPHISFVEPDMRIWRWTKVCEEIVAFNLSGGLRPVKKDESYVITVHNLGVERIPADFLRLFAQGLACNNFVDSVFKKDLGDTEEIASTSGRTFTAFGFESRFNLFSQLTSCHDDVSSTKIANR